MDGLSGAHIFRTRSCHSESRTRVTKFDVCSVKTETITTMHHVCLLLGLFNNLGPNGGLMDG